MKKGQKLAAIGIKRKGEKVFTIETEKEKPKITNIKRVLTFMGEHYKLE